MNILHLFAQVKIFIFDMDGVLTDGSLLILENGVMARTMNIKDGYALQKAIKKGYTIIVISGSNSPEVRVRLNKLGITEVFMNVADKKNFLLEYVPANQLDWNNMLYMGDDLPDFGAMKLVLLPCCPENAAVEIKQVSTYISSIKGGNGCVREVIEKVLRLQDDWDYDVEISSI